ncbi:hypothetical protein A2U01_0061620, partial [Trifolium medium]|nr:hypothetical protein [Trifolium medium]
FMKDLRERSVMCRAINMFRWRLGSQARPSTGGGHG